MVETIENTLVYQVIESESGSRLDQFLAMRAPELSRSRIKNLIDRGLAEIDGVCSKAARRVKAGQVVKLDVPQVAPVDLIPDEQVIFGILYEDSHIIVVNKPPDLVVHPATGHATGTLVHGLLASCSDLAGVGGELRPGIVHRLDKDTSGVMVVAKTDRAHVALVDGFTERKMAKTYLAICHGQPKEDRGQIDAPIGRHPVRRQEMSIRSTSGRPALTRWEVLRRFRMSLSLLRLQILTGRTHQIRVHLASIGCPVLGDGIYGRGTSGLKKGGGSLKGSVKRQMLHAHRLGLTHPVTGQRMEFEAPLPMDMVMVLELLEKNEMDNGQT